MSDKPKMSDKKFTKLWTSIICIVVVLTLVINVATDYFSGYVDLFLGTGDLVITKTEGSENWDTDYYSSDYSSSEETQSAAKELVKKIESEGAVLLKNNGVLPLEAPANVTLLGRTSADAVYGGSGSGGVSMDTVVDLKTGIEEAGYSINEEVYSVLEEYAGFTMKDGFFGPEREYHNPKANIVMDSPESSIYYIGEMPVENYNSVTSSFASYGDAAIITIGRGGGEGGDLTMDMSNWDDNYEPTQHQLELNKDEKELIDFATDNFENVIVLINASSAMELGVLENNDLVDAVLWIGSPGETGFLAVGELLNGTVSPSGRTVDIYPSDFTKDPTYVNFGNFQYNNIGKSNAMGDAYFVQYEEGIYVGYRYYETAAVEGFIDYDEAVVYPFGHGLSYTDFSWEVEGYKIGNVDENVTVDVLVTNTGSVAGKEVVQAYFSAPYTKGGIEKSHVVLADFAKTSLLEPGQSETIQISFPVEDMASYDYKENKAYVLDEGNYTITLQTDSHNVKEGIDPIIYNNSKTIIFSDNDLRASDLTQVTNVFDDVSEMFTDEPTDGFATNMSRSDFAGTFPTAPTTADETANEKIIEAYQAYNPKANEDPSIEMPTTGANNGLSLIDLRGLPYDDESWELLLDQLTVNEMTSVILNGAYTTFAMANVGKPQTVDFDGPAGITSFMTAVDATAFPSEVVIASTFNTDLAYEMGVMIGNEALDLGVNGWYAPAMNIHRNAFAGRNFEYYSEDPYISGKMGAYVVTGAATKGVYTSVKHYALNDQETNRVNSGGIATWANEQAIREIYLKPFEMTVKNATQKVKFIADEEGTVEEKDMLATTSIMSSFNRIGAVWAGGSKALMTTVLRDEWGFKGFVITDFNLYDFMYTNQGIRAGSDLMLTYESMKSIQDSSSATAVSDLRQATKNILFTVAHSNAMNDIAPGTIISYTMAPWKKALMVANVVVGLFALAGIFMIYKKRKNSTGETSIAE